MDDDARLMQLVSEGDERAFLALVQRYQGPIYNFFLRSTGSREDAEDLSQQLFVKLYLGARHYRPASAFRTYIFRIASNLAIDFSRKRRHRRFLSLDDMAEHGIEFEKVDSGATDPHESLEQLELREAYARALRALPSRWRTAVELRVGNGFSYKEIASIMGTSTAAVESMLFRARERLADALGKYRGS